MLRPSGALSRTQEPGPVHIVYADLSRASQVVKARFRGLPVAIKNICHAKDRTQRTAMPFNIAKSLPVSTLESLSIAAGESRGSGWITEPSFDISSDGHSTTVAWPHIKAAICSPISTGAEQRKYQLFRDMRFVSKLRHPCILNVMGAVVNDQVPKIVSEVGQPPCLPRVHSLLVQAQMTHSSIETKQSAISP